MQEPLVSICCVSYNHAPYIREALDGFLMQKTSFPFEIVVSDDCSPDGTHAIIEEYIQKYPDKFRDVSPQKNRGYIANYIYIYEHARGKYVAMSDGDDYWIDPYKLQKQVDFLEAHPDFSMCFHGAIIQNEADTDVLAKCDQLETREYFTRDIFPEWIIPTASVVYRREMVDSYPPLKHTEWMKYADIPIFLKCTHTGRVWGMADKMSVYRMTDSGAVVLQNKEERRSYFEKSCKHNKFLLENFPQVDKEWIYNFIGLYYYSLLRHPQNLTDVFRGFINVLRYKPSMLLKPFKRSKSK